MSLPSPPLTAGSEENQLPECSQGKKGWQQQGHAQGCYKRYKRSDTRPWACREGVVYW
jgi:hypothetical protein